MLRAPSLKASLTTKVSAPPKLPGVTSRAKTEARPPRLKALSTRNYGKTLQPTGQMGSDFGLTGLTGES